MAKKGLKKAVDDLLDPPKAQLIGPAPTEDGGARPRRATPGATTTSGKTRTFDLRPGRYRRVCAVADHHELGMRDAIPFAAIVRKAAPAAP